MKTDLMRVFMKIDCWCLIPILVACGGCSPTTVVPSQDRKISLEAIEAEPAEQSRPELKARIETVLRSSLVNRSLSATENAAWQIMHAVICYGNELLIETEDRGQVAALDYAFDNGLMRGFELMRSADVLESTGRPGIKAKFDPGSYIGQGHVDQWLAICAMAEVPIDTPVKVGQDSFTLKDWARQAQFDVSNNPVDEYSWTLIAMTHYFPDEPRWRVDGGEQLGWEELVEHELRQDIDMSPCGGTHRMAGMVRAVNAKRRLGLPDSAVWQRAEDLVARLLQSTKENRGADGRLSSYFFTRPGGTVDLTAELSSTGHVFEFVALACPVDELSSAWVEISAHRLCELLEVTAAQDLDCGALYHALNGLKIFYERRFD